MAKKKKGTHLVKKNGKIVVAPPKVEQKIDPRLLCSKCGCQPEPILRVSMGAGEMLCRKCYRGK